MITYVKGSLFDAPEGSLICHACNTKGVWGMGIAKEFKTRFPEAYDLYHKFCKWEGSNRDLRGEFQYLAFTKDSHRIGCLFTSAGYGRDIDDPDTILIHTTLSVLKVLQHATRESDYNDGAIITVYSNKFNSGLFNVPWEKTERVINTLLTRFPRVRWTVYTGE